MTGVLDRTAASIPPSPSMPSAVPSSVTMVRALGIPAILPRPPTAIRGR